MGISLEAFEKMMIQEGDRVRLVAKPLKEDVPPQEVVGRCVWCMRGQIDTITIEKDDGNRPCFEFPLVSIEKLPS